ncbi:YchJ family metal-binding protein, partial [Glaciecola sp.]|nr:YchJ family metal-binding protein [Glaciecola sp.]
ALNLELTEAESALKQANADYTEQLTLQTTLTQLVNEQIIPLDTKILPQSTNDAGQFYGEVEFKVFYSEAKCLYCLHERSTFVQEDGQWFYKDGVMLAGNGAVKSKRNDPCCCGSSKKFKQCCLPKIQ